jgi:uncharacterized delta-60 repeat protein
MTQSTVGGDRARRITRTRELVVLGRRGWGLRFVLTVLLGLSWTGHGHGAPGDLDPTFGTQGIVTTAFGGFGFLGHMILQPDGNIVVGGQSSASTNTASAITLVRYQPDGRLDATFGTGGIANTPPEGGFMAALVLQPDGKLVTAHVFSGFRLSPSSSRLVRYFSDGSLDPTFGDAGLVTSPADWSFSAQALTVQPDGKLVLAGFGGPIPPGASPPSLPPPLSFSCASNPMGISIPPSGPAAS